MKSQLVFRRSDAERFDFDRAKAPRLLVHQRGPKDSHTRLKDLTCSGLYLWYSGNTGKVDRASLMVYSIQGKDNLGWYVSFLNRGGWKVGRTRGISPEGLLLFTRPSS